MAGQSIIQAILMLNKVFLTETLPQTQAELFIIIIRQLLQTRHFQVINLQMAMAEQFIMVQTV